MTLQELVYSLKKAMLANPLVHTWIDDFNFTSAYHDIKYGAAALDIGLFNVDRKGFMTVNVNLYCFDRMYDVPSDSKMVRTENNSLPLYSKCMMVVQNAIKTMDTRIGIVDATYQPFRHRYTDDCAGVLCQLTLTAPFTICYDDFYEPIPVPDVTINAVISHGSVAATVNDVPVQLPYTAPRGTHVQLLVNPDDGYAFVEWSDHNTNNPRQVTMTTDLTLACECVVPVVTHVVVATATNGAITGSGVYNEGAPVLLKVTPSQHYHLNEGAWTGLPSSATFNEDFTEASFTADADYTVLVNCVEDTKYTVLVMCENCSSTSGGEFYEGDLVTLIAEPDLHYHMSATSWNGLPYWAERSADHQTVTFTIDNQDYNVTATGRIDKHTFTVEATNASYVSEGGTYDYGTEQHAMVTPIDGYHCEEGSWTGLPDDAVFNYNYTSVDFVLDQDRTVICNCYPDTPTARTLTFSSAEYGSVRGWVDGVEVTSPAVVAVGHNVRLVATPDEECHFVNWSDGTTASTYEFTMPDNDVTLEAFFAVNVYLLFLTYDAPEGMPVPTMSGGGTMPAGTERVVSTSAAETGYVFQGWYEESTLISSELSFTYTMPAHAVDLVAHYRALGTYTIAATCAHGTITGAGTYAEGDTCTLACTPSAHWNFDRWTEDGVEVSTSSTYSFVVNSDRALVAEVHEDTKYVLTFSAINGSVDKTSFVGYYGEEVVVEASTNLAHYHWAGWNDSITDNPRTFVATADADYVARFDEDTKYTLTFNGIHCSCSPSTFTGYYGDEIEVTAGNFDEHWHWGHWNDTETANPRTFTVYGSAIYTAYAEEDDKFTLQFNGNFCSCSPSSFTGYLGQSVEVDVVDITEHYHWGSWNDGSTDKPRTFTVGGSAIYTATCEIDQHTITTAVTPAGSGTVSGGGTYNYGASVTLTATANGGYQFVKWSDDVTTNPRSITVTGDATYTAEFELIPVPTYTLTFSAEEGGTATAWVNDVEVTSPATVHEGDAVVLQALGEVGYIFDGFEDEEGIIIVDNPYEFDMPAQDKTFVARFSPEIVGGYLTLTPVTTEESDPDAPAQAIIYLENKGTNNPQCLYSTDGGETWRAVPTTSSSAVTFQQPIYLKGVNASGFSTSNSKYSIIHLTGLSGSKVEASGSVMSLIDGIGESTTIPGSGYCFYRLFNTCTDLLTPPALPATTLASRCYQYMFNGCTSLTSAPALPATTLTQYCYYHMFNGCTSLINPPSLPATTLAPRCYGSMFIWCTSLTSAPALPATTLADYCYNSMFYGCTSLTSAPALPATTLTPRCYAAMFYGCSSLTSAPALPAETLAEYCYYQMFYECTSLTSAPALPATTLALYCYDSMFFYCTSLTSAPALPSTTLASYCYREMFHGCTSLTQAPALPATTLANNCYSNMFYGCTSLTGPVRISATSPYYTVTATACSDMFSYTGTSRPSTPTDYNKIKVGGSVSAWYTAADIDSTYWTVELITEDADDQLPDEPQSE